jgi:hypothetical protein
MQDTDLFMELAGIAGVFVGFGALIAVRSGGPSQPEELAPMRGMVSMGMLTVVAALAPVTLGCRDLGEHQVWALSSALVLVGLIGLVVTQALTPEYRAAMRIRRRVEVVEDAASALLMIVMVLAPIIIVLGLAPDLEAALYFTVVVLTLLGAGWLLLDLVISQRRPASA